MKWYCRKFKQGDGKQRPAFTPLTSIRWALLKTKLPGDQAHLVYILFLFRIMLKQLSHVEKKMSTPSITYFLFLLSTIFNPIIIHVYKFCLFVQKRKQQEGNKEEISLLAFFSVKRGESSCDMYVRSSTQDSGQVHSSLNSRLEYNSGELQS